MNYTGAVYIYYGNSTNGGVNNKADVIITGDQRYFNLGTRLHGADVNMDGFNDLMIGSKYAAMGGEQRGSVIVFFSRKRDEKMQQNYFSSQADLSFKGEQNYSWFGHDFVFHSKTSIGPLLVVSAPTYRYSYFFVSRSRLEQTCALPSTFSHRLYIIALNFVYFYYDYYMSKKISSIRLLYAMY